LLCFGKFSKNPTELEIFLNRYGFLRNDLYVSTLAIFENKLIFENRLIGPEYLLDFYSKVCDIFIADPENLTFFLTKIDQIWIQIFRIFDQQFRHLINKFRCPK